jgi:hypothetical protein
MTSTTAAQSASAAPGASASSTPSAATPAITWADVQRRLRDPFAPQDIEWRVQTAGEKNGKPWARVLAYVTSRAIMDRLDEAVGCGNWKDTYREGPAGGVVCVLAVRLPGTTEWVTKEDAAENTEIEPVKGGFSGSIKRAAVKWGIGRYLYDLEEGWATVSESGKHSAKTRDGKWFKWDPPALPTWAMPAPRDMTAEQRATIDGLLGQVRDARVVQSLQKRLAGAMTEAQADEAIRFLQARVSTPAAA